MRMSWRVIAGWLLVVAMAISIVFLIFSTSGSPTGAAYEFIHAVAKKDAAKAAELTWLPPGSPPAKQQWETLFSGKLKNFQCLPDPAPIMAEPSGNSALVKITFHLDPSGPVRETDLQIPMKLVDGKWKVDVTRTATTVWPALPK
jgi:hypothetical protein